MARSPRSWDGNGRSNATLLIPVACGSLIATRRGDSSNSVGSPPTLGPIGSRPLDPVSRKERARGDHAFDNHEQWESKKLYDPSVLSVGRGQGGTVRLLDQSRNRARRCARLLDGGRIAAFLVLHIRAGCSFLAGSASIWCEALSDPGPSPRRSKQNPSTRSPTIAQEFSGPSPSRLAATSRLWRPAMRGPREKVLPEHLPQFGSRSCHRRQEHRRL